MYTFDTFFTHDWGMDERGRPNHDRVARVYRGIQEAGFVAWFDEEQMRGDINKTMSDALEKSSCVVVFVTRRYIEKASGNGDRGPDDNCKFEFDNALLMEHLGVGKMIAVVMEPRCRAPSNWPNGTVKGKLGPKLYIDLCDDGDAFEAGVEKLIAEIAQVTGRAPTPPPPQQQQGSPAHPTRGPVRSLPSLSADDVAALLRKLELGKYAAAVRDFPMRGADLADATDEDLKEAGVSAGVHRRALLKQVTELARDGVPVACMALGSRRRGIVRGPGPPVPCVAAAAAASCATAAAAGRGARPAAD
jgi:hypothetical protein